MASIALGAAGTALGGAIGGSILGVSAATIGGAIGTAIGTGVDSWIVSRLIGGDTQRYEGQRLDAARITASVEGAVIPRIYGRMRVGGNVIWATDFREQIVTEREGGGGKGGGPVPEMVSTTYLYYVSVAVAVCEGPITGIGRIWADGKPFDREGVTWRWRPGDETQEPDAFILSRMGEETPAYRGTAYVVFEELLLERYGNRIPQFTFEVFRPVDDPDTAEGAARAVTIIPASGEFIYGTEKVTRTMSEGVTEPENVNAISVDADFIVSLERLKASVPQVESVSLVVSWFGTDLRAGECKIRPGVEFESKETSREWSVNGVDRANAHVVTKVDGRPVYGGTPSDFTIVEAIAACRARGYRVTFYPFILMDVPANNELPTPYSDNAGTIAQPVFPWRGRITCSPAAGFSGSVDKSATAGAQIDALFGSAVAGDFAVSGTDVSFTGTEEWSLRRMTLHYAHLCAVAGGVDSFIIGSELRGVTQVRSGASTYPAVAHLVELTNECRTILGGDTKISYAADWSEYFGHQPPDGSGDVYYHLDPLWSAANCDFVGIDNYMPLSDWRNGSEHVDAKDHQAIYERAYLQGNIEGGEGFEWFYASSADRSTQNRTPITDGAYEKPWVYRYKDLRSWWSNRHYDRPGGTESAAATGWVPESKPIRFTEFGCPAIDRGTNQPNVFYDPKSSESFFPYFSRGWRDDAIQRAYLEATLPYWGEDANNPVSKIYGGRMLDMDEAAIWTWDARPYPWFPALQDVWADGDNWRLGHWVNGRLGAVSLAALVRLLCVRAGLSEERVDVTHLWGALEGYVISALEAPATSIAMLARHFGFDAAESEGRIVFRMRGRKPAARLTLDDLVLPDGGDGDLIAFERAQETELPHALKWSLGRSDEEYDTTLVEARRVTVDASRIVAETFPIAVPPEIAERRVRRALHETWVGRESASFRLPPSRLAFEPGDVITLYHDGRDYELHLMTTTDSVDRSISAIMHDQRAGDQPSGEERRASVTRSVSYGAPRAAILDLPQLRDDVAPHQPLVAAYASPWPGSMSVYRSPSDSGFTRLTSFAGHARFGTTLEPFSAGPVSRFDLGNALVVELQSGTLQSVSDLALFEGTNAMAVETTPGVWEIVQAGNAELIANGCYRLTRLLRGQRGTEQAMAGILSAGARVVILDATLAVLPIGAGDIGLPYTWRIGPSRLPVSDAAYVEKAFAPEGRGLLPFPVVHVTQPYRHGRVPGDLTISWIRRSRDLSADNWAVEVPVAEETESYEIDILNGGTVIRTLTALEPRVVYGEAEQSADFGAALKPPDILTIRIAQLSATLGRGTTRMVSLQF